MRIRLLLLIMPCLLCAAQTIAQWQTMPKDSVLFGDFYTSIHFVSDSTGFLVGCTGYSSWDGVGLFKTKNAGASWSTIHGTGGSSDCRIPNSFVNEHSGYCILTYGTMQPNDLMKTMDGGAGWNNLTTTSGVDLGNQSFPGALYFADELLGFAAKDDTLYRTVNGGGGWQRVSTGHFIKALFFTSTQTGYAAGDNIILKTTDGGNNWQATTTNHSLSSLSFSSANVGYAVGAHATILKTTDAGNTWSPQLPGLPNTISLNSVFALDDHICFAVGDNGTILKTSNGGNSWVQQNSGVTARLNSISCTKTHCYAAGDTSVILKTADGALGIGATGKGSDPIVIFPNPFSKEGTIRIRAAAVTGVAMNNTIGQEFTLKYAKSPEGITISRGDLPAGVYFIRLMYGSGTVLAGKVVITD